MHRDGGSPISRIHRKSARAGRSCQTSALGFTDTVGGCRSCSSHHGSKAVSIATSCSWNSWQAGHSSGAVLRRIGGWNTHPHGDAGCLWSRVGDFGSCPAGTDVVGSGCEPSITASGYSLWFCGRLDRRWICRGSIAGYESREDCERHPLAAVGSTGHRRTRCVGSCVTGLIRWQSTCR